MSDRYVLVDSNGEIIDAVVWDGNSERWEVPAGLDAIPSDEYNIGGFLIDNEYTPPPEPEPEE